MHAYLINGGTDETRSDKAREIAETNKSKLISYEIKKIADVRDLEKHTRLSLRERTAFLLPSIDEASEESQNALLKTLEEPQEHAMFILTAQNEHSVIETIVSRCERINLATVATHDTMVGTFCQESVGEKLIRVSKITDRIQAQEFTKQLIYKLHDKLQKDENLHDIAHNLTLANQTYLNLKKNGNVALQLANLSIQMN